MMQSYVQQNIEQLQTPTMGVKTTKKFRFKPVSRRANRLIFSSDVDEDT